MTQVPVFFPVFHEIDRGADRFTCFYAADVTQDDVFNNVTAENFLKIACPFRAPPLKYLTFGNLNDTELGPCVCD